MKKVVLALILSLALVTASYALAQRAEETAAVAPAAPPAILVTEHEPLPGGLSDYWFVPDPRRLRALDPRGDGSNLARAAKAVAEGDFARALALLGGAAYDETPLADYADYYRALALQGLARLPEAESTLTALIERATQGPLAEMATVTLAEVVLAQQDAVRAEKLLRSATEKAAGVPDDTILLLAKAEEAADHREHAVEAYRRIYFRSPAGARADEAKAALDRLLSGAPYGSTADELARAERLFAARRWNDARAAFAALATTVSGGDRTRVVLRLAASETRLGRARAARDRLKPLLDDPEVRTEAQYLYGGALRALGDGAAYELVSRDLVERAPTSAWAVEALNDLAVYHLTRDEDDTADHVFRELLDRYPQHRYAERAAWKVGWAAYRSRRFADTIQVFESASTRFPRSDYRPSWVYWSARAREQMGDRSGAASLYQVAVADYGSSYYGRLAARLLAALPASAVASRARATRAPQASGAAPPTAVLFQTLMAAGLYDDALREVQFAQRTWGDSAQLQATSAWIRHQQARDLRGDGRFAALRGAITTMRRAYPQVLAAEGEDLPAEILQIVYPLGYWELIEAHAGAQGLDPYLVAALMAQESTFTAEIRSSANARGLMQIMPATGRQYARKLGIRSFTTASLARPDINVRIGVRYLKDLVDRFGAPYYALAAYNAGEARVSAWLKEHPDLPPDEFIDNIPFPETQNYVKRILGTAEDYRRLYGTGLLVPGRAVSAAAD